MKNYKDEKVGEKNISNNGKKMEIVYYKNATNVVVDLGEKLVVCTYGNFKKGSVTGNRINKSSSEIRERSYKIWRSMIQRCKEIKDYEDVEVCKEWTIYSNFREWYDKNYYEIEGETMALDKDILSSSLGVDKIYSPKTCIFIPRSLNALMIRSIPKINKNGMPTGVSKNSWRKHTIFPYKVLISNPKTKKTMLVGTYKTIKEAYCAYTNKKKEFLLNELSKYEDKIPKSVYDSLYNYKFISYEQLIQNLECEK